MRPWPAVSFARYTARAFLQIRRKREPETAAQVRLCMRYNKVLVILWFRTGRSKMSIQTINPTTGEVLETFEPYTERQINEALEQARHAFVQWRTTPFAERANHLHRIASHLRDHQAKLARLAVLEMGKSIAEAEAEVEKCAWNCDYFAEHAQEFLREEHVATNATQSYIAFHPLGVILAVMPWNFPYWQVFRFAAPTLMAGNTAVLKHASSVSGVALEIERIFQEAGLPQGVL